MKANLYLFLNIWLSIIGGIGSVLGGCCEWMFRRVKNGGIEIIEYSFKFDAF
jgi:hypothetical protein